MQMKIHSTSFTYLLNCCLRKFFQLFQSRISTVVLQGRGNPTSGCVQKHDYCIMAALQSSWTWGAD